MKTIKVNFVDFYDNMDKENFYFTQLLRKKYRVEISDHPDYLFYSVAGQEHHKYDCIRIFFTGENLIPNFNYCDYAFGFARLSYQDRYMRYPIWATWLYKNILEIAKRPCPLSDSELLNRKFCATVIGNSKQTDGIREKIFYKLNEYKPVASGGRWENNMPDHQRVADKIEFQSKYKFAMACENTKGDGYITEKILDAYASHAIPIYYGDPSVVEDFNPKSFINANDFQSLDDLLAFIKKVDQDDELYLKMIHAPIFQAGILSKYDDDAVLKFLSHIVDQPYEQAKRRHFFKPYADLDCAHLKMRDLKMIFKNFIIRPFKKGK